MTTQRFMTTFEIALCTKVETEIEFAGRTFKPDIAKAMFDAKIAHSLPNGNANDRGFSAATIANSYKSAEHQLCDFDHRLSFYAKDDDEEAEDRICGCMAAIDFPKKKDAIAMSEAGTAVPLRALLVAYRKAKGVDKMLSEIASGKYNWRTSIEVEYILEKAALYDTVTKEFFAWSDCSDDMKELVKPASVGNYKGHKMLFIPGGENGTFVVSGCAFTRWPADKEATLEQMAAMEKPKTLVLNAGWRNDRDYQQAVATAAAVTAPVRSAMPAKKPKPWKEIVSLVASLPTLQKAKEYAKAAQEISTWNAKFPDEAIDISEVFKANPIIGYTDKGGKDEHEHAITKNLMILPSGGHSHYMGMMSLENDRGGLHCVGCTSSRSEYMGDGKHEEHCHTFDLSGTSRSDMSGVGTMEVSKMSKKDRITALRESAQVIATSNPAESKWLQEMATMMEKETESESVEEIVAARVKNGDLIPKSAHETAVAAAKTEGEAKVRKEIEEKAKSEETRKTTIASRMEAIKNAKLDPKFALGKEKTIESVVASIPIGTDGDKQFADRLEEWTTIQKATGQMTATAASTSETAVERPAVASTNVGSDAGKKHGALGFV